MTPVLHYTSTPVPTSTTVSRPSHAQIVFEWKNNRETCRLLVLCFSILVSSSAAATCTAAAPLGQQLQLWTFSEYLLSLVLVLWHQRLKSLEFHGCVVVMLHMPACEYLKLETNMQATTTKVHCSFLKAVRCMEGEKQQQLGGQSTVHSAPRYLKGRSAKGADRKTAYMGQTCTWENAAFTSLQNSIITAVVDLLYST